MAFNYRKKQRRQTQNKNKVKQKPGFANITINLQQTQNSELFYNASFLNTKDAHPGGVCMCVYIYIHIYIYIYIYTFQWFTVDLFLNILVLLHATVSCI